VLPEDVALRRCVVAPAGFDARGSATSRSYEYRVLNAPVRSPLQRQRTVHVAKPLDLPALAEAAALARGEHVFRAFTPSESHHVRFRRVVSESRWTWYGGGLLVYRVAANSFLYGMVRALVGTMLEVGRGRYDLGDFERLLGGAERNEAGPAAPARGLTLVGVGYGDLDLWGGD
jgi:tRNA pseudouridine38-40 synthase